MREAPDEAVLVDTSVISFSIKRDTRAALYRAHLVGRLGLLAFVTVAELYRWPEERGWGQRRRADLDRLLETYRVAFPDDALCRRWALLMAATKAAGRPLPFGDFWIAATALHWGIPIVHNPHDFAGIAGLTIVSALPTPATYVRGTGPLPRSGGASVTRRGDGDGASKSSGRTAEQGQPVYYTGVGHGGYEAGREAAGTWADYIAYDMEHRPFDIVGLREFMRGLVEAGTTRSGHRTPTVIVTLPFDGHQPETWSAPTPG